MARHSFDQGKVPARSSITRTTSSTPLQTGFLGANPPSNDTDNNLSLLSGGREHFDFLKAGEIEKLDVLFARAIHQTATPYSAFSHPDWKSFFRALRGCYQVPSCVSIGGKFMNQEYIHTMNEVLLSLGKQPLTASLFTEQRTCKESKSLTR